MDELDYLILSELEKDATLPFVDIAKKVGTSACTVMRRFEKLKRKGTIFGCVCSINLGKIGYEGKTFLLINLTPNSHKSETIEYLRKIENVIIVTEIIGPCDIMAVAPITDLRSIQVLLEEAKKAPNIQKVEFYCISNVDFPIADNFGIMLSKKSKTIGKTKKIRKT